MKYDGNGRNIVICPKCKVPMIYLMEAEKSGSERRITRYYKCPVCGTKIVVERLIVRLVDGHYKIYRVNTGNQIIYSRAKIKQKIPTRRIRHKKA